MKRIGVLRFPGTNCDYDIFQWVKESGFDAHFLWYKDQFDFSSYEQIIIPGGFSFGDYLRSGALAARSPAMKSVAEAAKSGVPILGICNGFQILTEAGLLPGALVQNEGQRFIDKWVDLEVVCDKAYYASDKSSLRLPIAHGDGRYFIQEQDLAKLYDNNQVWLTYKNENPNGSVNNIAGVVNKNVAGLMPHPERAIFGWMGGVDGRGFL